MWEMFKAAIGNFNLKILLFINIKMIDEQTYSVTTFFLLLLDWRMEEVSLQC